MCGAMRSFSKVKGFLPLFWHLDIYRSQLTYRARYEIQPPVLPLSFVSRPCLPPGLSSSFFFVLLCNRNAARQACNILPSFFPFFQNWVSDAKCTYSQWITFPIESFPAVTCVWYLLISTLFLHTVNFLQFRTFLRALLHFINHDHNKYSLHMHYIKLKSSSSHLGPHRTTYDILPIGMTYLAFGEIFLNYFPPCLRLDSCHLAHIHTHLQKRSRQFHTVLYDHTRTFVLYETQFL